MQGFAHFRLGGIDRVVPIGERDATSESKFSQHRHDTVFRKAVGRAIQRYFHIGGDQDIEVELKLDGPVQKPKPTLHDNPERASSASMGMPVEVSSWSDACQRPQR